MTDTTNGTPLLRGQALLSDLVVAERLLGRGVLERLEPRLTPAQVTAIGAGFEPSLWYDEEIQRQLVALMAEGLTPAEQFAVGAMVSLHNLTRVQRFLARLAGPQVLLSRAAALWRYWRDTGTMAAETVTDDWAVVKVVANPVLMDPTYALIYGGACAHMVFATGAPNARLRTTVEPPLTVRFEVRWSKPSRDEEPDFFEVRAALAWAQARFPAQVAAPKRTRQLLNRASSTTEA